MVFLGEAMSISAVAATLFLPMLASAVVRNSVMPPSAVKLAELVSKPLRGVVIVILPVLAGDSMLSSALAPILCPLMLASALERKLVASFYTEAGRVVFPVSVGHADAH